MTTDQFAVPIGWTDLSTKTTIYPKDSERHHDYYCPTCQNVIHRRGGPIVRDHFYHIKPGQYCSQESVYHSAAKTLLGQWIEAGRSVVILDDCPRCKLPRQYPLPQGATQTERQVGIFRADLAYVDDHNEVQAVIEIRYTHAVDDRKAEELDKPWIEFDALEVLSQEDKEVVELHPLASGGGWGPEACAHCRPLEFIPTQKGKGVLGCPRFPLAMMQMAAVSCATLGESKGKGEYYACIFLKRCGKSHIHCDATTDQLADRQVETEAITSRYRLLYYRERQLRDKEKAEREALDEIRDRQRMTERERYKKQIDLRIEEVFSLYRERYGDVTGNHVERIEHLKTDESWMSLLRYLKKMERALTRIEDSESRRSNDGVPVSSLDTEPTSLREKLIGKDMFWVRCPKIVKEGTAIPVMYLSQCAECSLYRKNEDFAMCGYSNEPIDAMPLQSRLWK